MGLDRKTADMLAWLVLRERKSRRRTAANKAAAVFFSMWPAGYKFWGVR
jgi:hypothetical protein